MTLLWGASVGLFLGMLALQEVGHRLGSRRTGAGPAKEEPGTGVIDAAVFALLGLLLAFQFAGAAGRLDRRRDVAVQEANAIGTAYLRLDLLNPERQLELRDLFRQYTEARLRTWEVLPDLAAAEAENAASQKLQAAIWSRSVAACRGEATPSLLLLPALNEMIDVTTTREIGARTHVPGVVIALLFAVALMSALLAGVAMAGRGKRNLLHMSIFAAVTAILVYTILDLEYPRLGFIRVGAADQALRDVRTMMN
jgi:hypothetical protein